MGSQRSVPHTEPSRGQRGSGTPRSPRFGAVSGIFQPLGEPSREGSLVFFHRWPVSGLSLTQSPAGADEDQGTSRSPRTGAVPGIFHPLGEPPREGSRMFLHRWVVSGLSLTPSPAGADEDQGTPRSPRTGAVPGIFHRLGEPPREGSRMFLHRWVVSGLSPTRSPNGVGEDRGIK